MSAPPPLPPWAFARHAPRLAALGYSPIPIIPRQKRPPFEGWQQGGQVAGWLPRYAGHGVGVLSRSTPALDIDVTNAGLADDIQTLADRVLGDASGPLRRAPETPDAIRPQGRSLHQGPVDLDPRRRGRRGRDTGSRAAMGLPRRASVGLPVRMAPRSKSRASRKACCHRSTRRGRCRFLRALAAVLRRLGATDLKPAGWELEERRARRVPLRHRYPVANDAAPPWHGYSPRELAEKIDPDGAHEYRGWWRCQCPAHPNQSGHHTSLVIRRAEDGRPGWHCFGGCADRDVAREIARIVR